MPVPSIWKYFLSFLYDVLLEKSSSEYNPVLEVFLSRGRIKLVSKGAIYSYGDLYDNFKQVFEYIDIENRTPHHILVLGLGTGSILYMLEKHFSIQAEFTAVEIDPEIIRLFNFYTRTKLQSKITLVQMDGWKFIEENQAHYDLICMDIFDDQEIPDVFLKKEYLMMIRSALQKNGLLIFNHLAESKSEINSKHIFYETIFKKTFIESDVLKLKNNWMMIGYNPEIN
ncbi:MAG: methyltransferase domain-containing protein [Bacteroidota bacterium]|nr:methyltransferase domain-containing protein [Bacteroidota bacterium]